MEDKIINKDYIRKYVTKDGDVKTYTQHQSYTISNNIIVGNDKSDNLQTHINDTVKMANRKVKDLKRIDSIIKALLQYRGYNKRNLDQRIFRLEKANEITMEDKKLLVTISNRQKNIAGDLTSLLKFVLQLYDSYDAEIKELSKELEEYNKK